MIIIFNITINKGQGALVIITRRINIILNNTNSSSSNAAFAIVSIIFNITITSGGAPTIISIANNTNYATKGLLALVIINCIIFTINSTTSSIHRGFPIVTTNLANNSITSRGSPSIVTINHKITMIIRESPDISSNLVNYRKNRTNNNNLLTRKATGPSFC